MKSVYLTGYAYKIPFKTGMRNDELSPTCIATFRKVNALENSTEVLLKFTFLYIFVFV